MDLGHILDELHFAPDRNTPPDWEVNWEDAPRPFKLYRGLPCYELSHEIPYTVPALGTDGSANPALSTLGHFLWYTFGLTRVSRFPEWDEWNGVHAEDLSVQTNYRRFAPSGGGLYPSELYIYLKVEELPCGVYHYDVAHHRLVLLREGNMDTYIQDGVVHFSRLSNCFAVAFVSTLFWKNFFKYHNFSYRLQGLDAGALLGQMRMAANRFGFSEEICFQFLDRAMNHLLGLNSKEESVYAVVPLWETAANTDVDPGGTWNKTHSAEDLCQRIPEIQTAYFLGSKTIRPYPTLLRLNEACFIESLVEQRPRKQKETSAQEDGKQSVSVPLPNADPLPYDFRAACQNRQSPSLSFVPAQLTKWELASLFQEAAAAAMRKNAVYRKHGVNEESIQIYACLHGIDGIQDGAYQYDSERHQLRQIRVGDQRAILQSGMSMHTVNMFHVPICVHLAGKRNHHRDQYGYRGHRIQHMQAGILLQSFLLSASAHGMNGHPLLDFEASICDAIYDLEANGETVLVQVPIGRHRNGSCFTSSLHA